MANSNLEFKPVNLDVNMCLSKRSTNKEAMKRLIYGKVNMNEKCLLQISSDERESILLC